MDVAEKLVNDLAGNHVFGRIIIAAVILVLTAVIAHLVMKWMRHMISREDEALANSTIFTNIVLGLIWGISLCLVLDACFGVNMTAIIAALGVGGIAISLGFQDTLANFIGGAQVTFMRIIKPGDNIMIGVNKGIVQDITWRHTRIKNAAGEIIIIPNSIISKNAVVQLPPPERVVVPFIVSPLVEPDDIKEEIFNLALAVAAQYSTVVEEPKVVFTDINDTGSIGKVFVVIQDADKAGVVSDAIIRALAPVVFAPHREEA